MRRTLSLLVIALLAGSIESSGMSFTNLEGEEQQIKVGKPTIIEIFATWCSACKEQHPILAEVYSSFIDMVTLLSLSSSDKDSIETIREFLLDFPSNWSYGLDTDKYFWKEYGVPGSPTFLTFSDNGVFLGCKVGLQQKNELEYIFQSTIEGEKGDICPTVGLENDTPPELIFMSFGLVVVFVLFRLRKRRKVGE